MVSVAEEVENPERNLVLGMGLSFTIVLAFYVVVTLVTVGLVEPSELKRTLTPINLGAKVSMGTTGVIIVSVAAILAFISTANAGILAASRVPMAMSRDRLLPSRFDRVHERRRTPTLAVLVTGGYMVAVILALDLEGLVKTASTLKLLLFGLVNVAVIAMRESRIQNYRPSFKSPFYPWVQIVGVLASAVLIPAMGAKQLLLAAGFIVVSLIWYAIYGRRAKAERSSALVHVVERIAGRDLTCRTLSAELREIVRERDGIGEDRFDRLVRASPIIDLEDSCTLDEFFSLSADALADRVGLPHDELVEILSDREHETPTALVPSVAAPHAIIEGETRFEMLIARSRKGIRFCDDAPAVKTIFVLVGTPDERNFHLHALMAIAQMAELPTFATRWRRAQAERDLRDILLLADRTRHD